MTKIKLTPPASGEKDSAAEPKVTTALKELEEWLNGKNIETTDNLKAGGIEEASLATAVQEKLTTRLGFVLEKKNESFTAVTEKVYLQEKAGATVTLPAATLNRIVTVFCTASSCKVKTTAGVIKGLFLAAAGVAEVTLTEGQSIMVIADGTNWEIIAGEPRREQKYSVATVRAEGVEFEPSATRPTLVTAEITVGAAALAGALFAVGGENAGELVGTKELVLSLPLLVPPGVKWKWTKVTALPIVQSRYFTL